MILSAIPESGNWQLMNGNIIGNILINYGNINGNILGNILINGNINRNIKLWQYDR